MPRSWDELQRLKDEAINNDDLKHAIFWQNEQISMQLKSLTWSLKLIVEKGTNV
jgi:hypothetical protein